MTGVPEETIKTSTDRTGIRCKRRKHICTDIQDIYRKGAVGKGRVMGAVRRASRAARRDL